MAGKPTLQRWAALGAAGVTVDFLVPPPDAGARAGGLLHIEGDLAAIVTPGLGLAFRDRERVTLRGPTASGYRWTSCAASVSGSGRP